LVEAPVEESRASSVRLGDAVALDIEALGRPVVGQVGEIVPTVDAASRAFLVKVDLPAELAGLRPGMFARVSFRVGRKTPLVVPASAVTRSGALDRLFVAEGDRVRLRMVTLGETQGDWTEVLSGLAVGERVVASPSPVLADGIRFTERP
jgi:multidrug efflux pump subunit AcrA (membrane-fusion protein)